MNGFRRIRTGIASAALALALFTCEPAPAPAAEPTGTFWIAAPNELGFITGGIRGRYLIFESWDATTDWPTNTVLQHAGELWWAESDPAVGDTPGTASAWTQLSGSTGGGGGSLTQGTADPTGGSDGDAYIQTNASNAVQSLWLNSGGSWSEYTIPSDGVVSGGSVAGTTLTLTRTNNLPDITIGGLPTPGGTTTDGVANSVDLSLSGQNLSLTLGRTIGVDLSDTVALPASGLTAVTTDSTLTGAGTSGDALSVANPPATWAYASGATGTAPSARLPGYTVHRESSSDPYDPANGVITFTVNGTDLSDGDMIVFDAPSNLGSDSSVQLSVNVNNTGVRNLIDREENRINETHLIADAWYIIQRDSASYSVLTSLEDVASWAQANDATGTAPVARLGTGSPSTTTFLRGDGTWQAPGGLTQSQGDSRYAQLASANTFTTGPQNIDFDGLAFQVDARQYTGGDPVLAVRTGPTGNRKAFSAAKGDDAQPWFAIEYNIGGANKPGFGISQGGTSIEDVILYRDAQNVFRTADAFHVGSLRVDAAGRSSSRTQLGLGTAAVESANRLLPAGGASGQVLAKSSATDYDVGWVASSGTGVTSFVGLSAIRPQRLRHRRAGGRGQFVR